MRVVLAVALLMLGTGEASAQARLAPAITDPKALDRSQSHTSRDTLLGLTAPQGMRGRPRSTYWAIAASAAIPGAGQAVLGERRFLPYVAFELYSWAQYTSHIRESRERRDEYRSLAATVARAPLSSVQPQGDFDYYERLEHYLESGMFDVVPGGALDPEPDTATYNGFVWLLARRTFWKDVNHAPDRTSDEWQLAERLYRRRAYGDDYRWSWRNAQLEFDEYRRRIRAANDANRRAVQDLGLLIANHTLSMVDAYVTIRVRRHVGVGGEQRTELSVSIPVR
jgi:hypothetical protein